MASFDRRFLPSAVVLVVALSAAAPDVIAQSSTTEKTLAGGAVGAAGGALLGAIAGNAAVGAAVGGGVGLLVGHMKATEEKK